jgi:hypothetical protein
MERFPSIDIEIEFEILTGKTQESKIRIIFKVVLTDEASIFIFCVVLLVSMCVCDV